MDVGKFGEGVYGHGNEKRFAGGTFDIIQFFAEVHVGGTFLNGNAFQGKAGGKEGISGFSIGSYHFFQGCFGSAVFGLYFHGNRNDFRAFIIGLVVGQ